MPLLTRDLRRKLLTALGSLLALDAKANRDSLLRDLPSALVGTIPRNDAKAMDLDSIVEACARWDPADPTATHPLHILIENALPFAAGQQAAQALCEVLAAVGGTPCPPKDAQAPEYPPQNMVPAPSRARGIPNELAIPLRNTLLDCGPVGSDRTLHAFFAHDLLKFLQNRLPEADDREERVDLLIDFLHDKRRQDTRISGLVLMLGVLRDRLDSQDECYAQVDDITEKLAKALQPYSDPGMVPADHILLQAGSSGQKMIFVEEILQLVQRLPAVARVTVPRIVGGHRDVEESTGTGWLVTPQHVLTCLHVIAARRPGEATPAAADMQAQVQGTLFTFDLIRAGQGKDYKVEALECSDPDLDYALLRIKDRQNEPLAARSPLTLAPHDPLTSATRLYIIQHPWGQPAQSSDGRYARPALAPHRIYHTAPAEEGTSGAPVINLTSWGVVALHTGAESDGSYRLATPIADIFEDIQRKKTDLAAQLKVT